MARTSESGDIDAGHTATPERGGYRRSTGSARGEARRRQLLDSVADDLAANGLVGFSLRRAARAAGTTHKVMLYHFDDADDLLVQAIVLLREKRIAAAFEAAGRDHARLSERVRALWSILTGAESGLRVLDQAIGLAMYDPARNAPLGVEASKQYLPLLLSICPAGWDDRRKHEVAAMILAALRGFLVDWLISGESTDANPGFAALARALDREEAARA
ncbi:TetR/AcrR family transcriptional regulator [Nocardia sp. CDC153]|uniref:TetR/AcrR family transcriptional regulator n=1 Tax=Nocardia sp. CDC153 TaxID=3112167 RepID=UPI002DBBEE65|nr:TetR/AcrR family transcriptional regulator [Nocardia sp. CDC153]MEC3952410.1 TetR/AcrR family transcriptional regulator [Nocardia sp. CDC153]